MSDSPPPGHQEHSVEQEVEKAHVLANTLTLNSLRSKLNSNPAADLAHALKQQADVYPKLRGSLEQTAQKEAAAREKNAKETTQTGQPDAQSERVEINEFLINGPIQITHLLGKEVMELAGVTSIPPEAASQHLGELATGLSKAVEKGEILWELHGLVVLGLGTSEVVKISPSLDHDEVTNLTYINTHVPAVPAPSCLGCLTTERKTYFFMSRADGVTLESLWADLDTEHKLSIQAQLNTIFHSLRNAPSPSQDGMPKFGSFSSAICNDVRRQTRTSSDPIRNEAQFNDFLCSKTGGSAGPWINMIRSGMRDDHRLVMTHADLHPRNIMVGWEEGGEEEVGVPGGGSERRLRITALIDWESSGWYPEYWEFVKALSTTTGRGKMADWFKYLPTEAIGTWPVELSVDSLLDRWLG